MCLCGCVFVCEFVCECVCLFVLRCVREVVPGMKRQHSVLDEVKKKRGSDVKMDDANHDADVCASGLKSHPHMRSKQQG